MLKMKFNWDTIIPMGVKVLTSQIFSVRISGMVYEKKNYSKTNIHYLWLYIGSKQMLRFQ